MEKTGEEEKKSASSVRVHVYDLSKGMAAMLSQPLLGKHIDGVWHTGVVVFGREYYFGSGINVGRPGATPFGEPLQVLAIGETEVPVDVFEDFLREIADRYTPQTYSLLTHNCNNFSDEVCQFLTGEAVPDAIVKLPEEVMKSPLGQAMMPMLMELERQLSSGGTGGDFGRFR